MSVIRTHPIPIILNMPKTLLFTVFPFRAVSKTWVVHVLSELVCGRVGSEGSWHGIALASGETTTHAHHASAEGSTYVVVTMT